MKRTGSIASAGVLISAGLFGAYVGNPRLQRAYASPACLDGSGNAPGFYFVDNTNGDDSLVAALDDSTVTCIQIQGGITLSADLPDITDVSWSGGPRDSGTGLTLYGLGGDDTIDGALTHGGLKIALTNPLDDTFHLSLSGLTMANLRSNYLGAVSVRVSDYAQPGAVVEVDLAHSTFTDNSAPSRSGGAVRVSVYGDRDVIVSASDDAFVGNESGGDGGAIAASSNGSDVTLRVCDSFFAGNSATKGGAIFAYSPGGGGLYVNDHVGCAGTTVFADDTALGYGGAIFTYNLNSRISDAEFTGNESDRGGGLAVFNAPLTLVDSTVSGNKAAGGRGGGGIYSNGAVTVTSSAIINNEATFGGGGVSAADARFTNSYVGGNRAQNHPGIYAYWGHIGLYFSTVYDDTLTGSGVLYEISFHSLTAVGSVVANQWTDNTLEPNMSATVDDTAFITDDSLSWWTPGPGSHVLAPGQGLALAPRDDTLIPGHAGRTPLASSPLAVAVADDGFAPATNPWPLVTVDQLGVTRVSPFTIGARQFVAPTPPVPPAPPSEPPSAPRDPRAVAGDRRAVVSWVAPASSGSFPVTNYQVVASPGGAQCLVAAPALSCTVEGLTNGTGYAFRAKALNGAGWSPESALSHEVTPHGDPAILITGSREGREVKVVGATTGIESSTVVPRFRFPGQTEYQSGLVRPTIEATGNFTWSRTTGRTIYLYFVADKTHSNRLVIRLDR